MHEHKHGARAATAGPCCSCQQGSSRSLQTVALRILAHMEMNRGGQSKNLTGLVNVGSGHGMAKAAGKHSPQKKAAAGKHSRQMNWPAQALKKNSQQMNWPAQALQHTRPADGTGLAAKQQLPMKLAGTGLEEKQPAGR